MGAIKTGWNALKGIYKYTPQAFKSSVKGNALTRAAVSKMGAKGVRYAKGGAAVATGLGAMLGDSGPDENETMQRAMNQLRYGADMTDDQLQEAIKEGKTFQDTGLVGENGLNEEQVRQYIASQADQRGGLEKWGGRAMDALSFINPVATIGGAIYDSKLGDARNQNLTNIVEKLKADANEGKIRKNMEGSLGKFMAEGILNKDFGRGNVRQAEGGIKPPVDAKAQQEEADALKEYEAIKARDGVYAALASPAALKAGRQVYLDVQEASGGDKNTAEALLSGVGGQNGVGLTDQDTMERYYGNAKENALANRAASAEAMLSSERSNAAMAKAAAAEQTRKENVSGPIEVAPATTAEQVRSNQALINAQGGFHGESPVAAEQRAYLEENGIQTARSASRHMNAVGNAMYQKAYGYAPGSPEATADAWGRLYRNIEAGKKEYQANRAKLADIEYAGKIVKPGDADYALGARPRTQEAQDEYMAATTGGGGSAPAQPSVPAQVNAAAAVPQAPVAAPSRAAILTQGRTATPVAPVATPAPSGFKPTPYGVGTATPGFPKLPDIGAPVRNAVENALTQKSSRPANVMAPTPYGLGTATPGIPQIPDIGAPVRNAVDRALTQQTSRPSNVMAPTPYGLGTATPGVPQVPDIGAPVRNAVQGALTQTSSPPGVAPKKPMDQAEIAKLIAEQERQKIEARNRANPNPNRNPVARPNPMSRFR